MKPTPPRQITRNNAILTHAGPGRAKGSECYLNHATTEVIELWSGLITATGLDHDTAHVPGNGALVEIRVPKKIMTGKAADLTVGSLLLMEIKPAGLFSKAGVKEAWPMVLPAKTTPAAAPVPAPIKNEVQAPPRKTLPASLPRRMVGSVERVTANGFGFVTTPYPEWEAFVHVSDLPAESPFVPGLRLDYAVVTGPKGLIAKDIRVLA